MIALRVFARNASKNTGHERIHEVILPEKFNKWMMKVDMEVDQRWQLTFCYRTKINDEGHGGEGRGGRIPGLNAIA